MIRCFRMFTGDDNASRFEEGTIDFGPGERGDLVSPVIVGRNATFRETAPGGNFAWHPDPVRRLVITLKGSLRFTMRGGDNFTVIPGDVILAEDNVGTGHRWELIDGNPWRRMYVELDPETPVPFSPIRNAR